MPEHSEVNKPLSEAEEEVSEAIEVRAEASLASADIANAFGGEEVDIPTVVSYPEIELTKSDYFKGSDGEKYAALVGHIVYARRSRAYWPNEYDGSSTPPACASSDCITPDTGEDQQSDLCASCDLSQWQTLDDGSNKIICSESLNIVFVPDGKRLPHLMRVRSTSMGKKSSISKFFTSCADPSYALAKKYQTVKVKLTLEETKINNFDTSILNVEKIETLTADNKLLPELIAMYKAIDSEFSVEYTQANANDDDDIPI